jgi:hypothetical protein
VAIQGIKVEVAFTTTPFAAPNLLTWTDISATVLDVDIQRGRQYEIAQQQAGVCTVQLDNIAGNFDPDNTAGLYYPQVLPLLPIRVTSVFSATSYPLFYGFIEAWVQTWDAARFNLVTITASDAIKALFSYSMGLGYTEFVVQDYGGTIGTPFTNHWPFTFVGPVQSQLNYYLGSSAGVPVGTAGDFFQTNGIALSCFQLVPPTAYYYWDPGNPGSRGYWCGFEGWLRLDATIPTGQPKCLVFNGNKNSGGYTALQGFGVPFPAAASGGDSMSVYATQNPKNLCAAATADPTSLTGWSHTTTGVLSSVAIATTNGLRRIYLDNGAIDFFGATAAVRLTCASATSGSLSSPFITGLAAGLTYTAQLVYTQEQAAAAGTTIQVDWYNGAALLSSTTIASPTAPAIAPTVINAQIVAPASTTQAKITWVLSSPAGTTHFDLAQLMFVTTASSSFSGGLPWYAGLSTPAPQLMFIVAAGSGVAPPGQANSTTGWPCYGVINFNSAPLGPGNWVLVDIDSGTDNCATPYSGTAATRGMPQAWVNGVAVRMWTTGDATGTNLAGVFTAACYAGIGAQLYGGGATPAVLAASETPASYDELYVADTNIGAAGRVTAAKALSHYNYSLASGIRHDFFLQTTGFRMQYIIEAMGYPAALGNVGVAMDAGQRQIQLQLPQTSATATTGISLIEDANNVEGGLYFIGASGQFTFFDSAHVLASTAELLTANDQGFEGGLGSWVADASSFNGGNCTVTQSTTFAHSGTHSMRLQATLVTGPQNAVTGFYPVTAGQPYTASMWARAAVTPETAVVRINWYNAALTLLTGVANFASDAVGSWTQVVLAAQVAPPGAVWAKVGCETGVSAAGELHYFDDFTFTGPVPSAVFGDRPDLGEIPYRPGPSVSKDDTYIFNYAVTTVTVTDGITTPYTSAPVQDANSQAQYKVRNTSLSAPWSLTTDADAAAASLVNTFKQAATRISSVSVDAVQTGAFATLLPLDLGALVQVNIRPMSAGPIIANACYVQGLHLHATPQSWQYDYSLAPHLFSR